MLVREEKHCLLKLCDASHPIFKAHFPKNPILPGFVLLEVSAALFGLQGREIQRAKFLQTVLPQSILTLNMEEKEKNYKVVVMKDELKVAEIVYAKN